MPITPETKDWTWALEKRCDDCGYDAPATEYESVPALARAVAARLAAALDRPDVRVRPNESTWSPLEYVTHTRDVCRVFEHRLQVALTGRAADPVPDVLGHDATVGVGEDGVPVFAGWDHDATALDVPYLTGDSVAVAAELQAAADRIATVVAAVEPAQRSRAARRTDGARFTVEGMARYFLHDLVHHAHDLGA